jgi:DNA repair exonuclease SbcCD ATPase subunit
VPGKIKLENIRSVSELDFAIPDRGVWLLTGGNGAGKSSLLACLRRIGYRLAFPIHFPGSQ